MSILPSTPPAPPLRSWHGLRGTRSGWQAELRERVAHRLWLKVLGICAFMWLFFIGYFHVLRHPSGPPTIMPTTAFDEWIGFQPGLLGAYVSLWVYLGIAPGLLLGLRALIVYGLWAALLCATGLACFYLWPTAIVPISVDLIAHPTFAVLQGVDSTGNACPSLHVATAAYTAVWIDHLVRRIGAPTAARVANIGWFLLIAYSTLAIKQHVVLDALAGLALGLFIAALSLRFHAAESLPRSSAYHPTR